MQRLAQTLREMCITFLPRLEAVIGDSIDLAASAAAAAGEETIRHVRYNPFEGYVDVHGLPWLARRPGKGKDASGLPVSQAMHVANEELLEKLALPFHIQSLIVDTVTQVSGTAPPRPIGFSHLQQGPIETAPRHAGSGTARALGGTGGGAGPSSPSHHAPSLYAAAGYGGAGTGGHHAEASVGAGPGRGFALPDFVALAGLHNVAVSRLAHKLWVSLLAETLIDSSPERQRLAAVALIAATKDITLSAPPRPPYKEEHLMLTRYDGGVASYRLGSQQTYVLIDGRTPALSDVQEKMVYCASRHPPAATTAR